MDKRTKRGKNFNRIEVCYQDEKGISQRIVCDELDRTAIKLGDPHRIQSQAEAHTGFIQTIGAFREVQFMPLDLHWVRIYKD